MPCLGCCSSHMDVGSPSRARCSPTFATELGSDHYDTVVERIEQLRSRHNIHASPAPVLVSIAFADQQQHGGGEDGGPRVVRGNRMPRPPLVPTAAAASSSRGLAVPAPPERPPRPGTAVGAELPRPGAPSSNNSNNKNTKPSSSALLSGEANESGDENEAVEVDDNTTHPPTVGGGIPPFVVPVLASPPPREPVVLNVYHLIDEGPNNKLDKMGIGLFHTGVEIYRMEWSYGEAVSPSQVSGIFVVNPRTAMPNVKASIVIGHTALSPEQVDTCLHRLENEWLSVDYHVTHNNCNHFADYFLQLLSAGLDKPLTVPKWVNRLSNGLDWFIPKRLATWAVRAVDGSPPVAVSAPVRGKIGNIPPSVVPEGWYRKAQFARTPKYTMIDPATGRPMPPASPLAASPPATAATAAAPPNGGRESRNGGGSHVDPSQGSSAFDSVTLRAGGNNSSSTGASPYRALPIPHCVATSPLGRRPPIRGAIAGAAADGGGSSSGDAGVRAASAAAAGAAGDGGAANSVTKSPSLNAEGGEAPEPTNAGAHASASSPNSDGGGGGVLTAATTTTSGALNTLNPILSVSSPVSRSGGAGASSTSAVGGGPLSSSSNMAAGLLQAQEGGSGGGGINVNVAHSLNDVRFTADSPMRGGVGDGARRIVVVASSANGGPNPLSEAFGDVQQQQQHDACNDDDDVIEDNYSDKEGGAEEEEGGGREDVLELQSVAGEDLMVTHHTAGGSKRNVKKGTAPPSTGGGVGAFVFTSSGQGSVAVSPRSHGGGGGGTSTANSVTKRAVDEDGGGGKDGADLTAFAAAANQNHNNTNTNNANTNTNNNNATIRSNATSRVKSFALSVSDASVPPDSPRIEGIAMQQKDRDGQHCAEEEEDGNHNNKTAKTHQDYHKQHGSRNGAGRAKGRKGDDGSGGFDNVELVESAENSRSNSEVVNFNTAVAMSGSVNAAVRRNDSRHHAGGSAGPLNTLNVSDAISGDFTAAPSTPSPPPMMAPPPVGVSSKQEGDAEEDEAGEALLPTVAPATATNRNSLHSYNAANTTATNRNSRAAMTNSGRAIPLVAPNNNNTSASALQSPAALALSLDLNVGLYSNTEGGGGGGVAAVADGSGSGGDGALLGAHDTIGNSMRRHIPPELPEADGGVGGSGRGCGGRAVDLSIDSRGSPKVGASSGAGPAEDDGGEERDLVLDAHLGRGGPKASAATAMIMNRNRPHHRSSMLPNATSTSVSVSPATKDLMVLSASTLDGAEGEGQHGGGGRGGNNNGANAHHANHTSASAPAVTTPSSIDGVIMRADDAFGASGGDRRAESSAAHGRPSPPSPILSQGSPRASPSVGFTREEHNQHDGADDSNANGNDISGGPLPLLVDHSPTRPVQSIVDQFEGKDSKQHHCRHDEARSDETSLPMPRESPPEEQHEEEGCGGRGIAFEGVSPVRQQQQTSKRNGYSSSDDDE